MCVLLGSGAEFERLSAIIEASNTTTATIANDLRTLSASVTNVLGPMSEILKGMAQNFKQPTQPQPFPAQNIQTPPHPPFFPAQSQYVPNYSPPTAMYSQFQTPFAPQQAPTTPSRNPNPTLFPPLGTQQTPPNTDQTDDSRTYTNL